MKKIALIIATIIALGTASFSTPVMAENEYNPIIFTDCGSGSEESIRCILNYVVDVLSIGVGILGVIGISIVGIQYLTAGGSEEKTRKAKQRMFEIILGLAIYAVIAVLLKWLNIPSPGN